MLLYVLTGIFIAGFTWWLINQYKLKSKVMAKKKKKVEPDVRPQGDRPPLIDPSIPEKPDPKA